MKKTVLACLAVFLLAGCSGSKKSDTVPTADSRQSVSIKETDFTQKDAESVLQSAVSSHCGTDACTVTAARIIGTDIEGSYTYTINGVEKQAEAVLYDVMINPNDKSEFTYSNSKFTDNRTDIVPTESTEPEETVQPSDDDTEKLDLPDHVDEDAEDAKDDQKVYDESGLQVYRMYMNKGTIEFGGTYSGDSKFIITIMDLNQKTIGQPVNMKQPGEIEGSLKLDEGYYYIKIEFQGGWELTWNRTFE